MKDPPCETCRVELMPDNKEASMVYNIVQNQFIMGFNGPVDLNQSAVWECIDRYRVKDPIKVFERVS